MIRGLFNRSIIIYDIFSCIEISHHSVPDSVDDIIWTHGKCLQFATIDFNSIVIWEVHFTSGHVPIQIGSLHTPHNFYPNRFVFLPTLSLFAFFFG